MKMFQDEEHIVMSRADNYFKDLNGTVYAYDDRQVADGLAGDKTAMTPEEVEAHINPAPTPEQLQQQANAEARAYLAETDWYVIRLQETDEPVPAEILAERSAARARVIE